MQGLLLIGSSTCIHKTCMHSESPESPACAQSTQSPFSTIAFILDVVYHIVAVSENSGLSHRRPINDMEGFGGDKGVEKASESVMMMVFTNRGGEGLGDKEEYSQATRSSGKNFEERYFSSVLIARYRLGWGTRAQPRSGKVV